MRNPSAADDLRRRQPELVGELFAAGPPARLFGPRLGTRIVSRLRADALDRALANGADPAQCPRLAARAAHLTNSRTRAQLAETITRFVIVADGPPSRIHVRPARSGVQANRRALLALAAVLRDDVPVYARGVAALELMLRDGTGPAYVDGDGEALTRELALVDVGLRG